MSVYGVHKFLRTCQHDRAFRALALEDPEAALARMPLSDDEKAAMRAGDVAWLYEHGVHAFLLSFFTRWTLFGVTNDLYTQRIHQARDARLS
ncbi:MAG: aromatic-ring-opening dioxygenase LigAB, LigA subunit [Hyphomicrobiales bacterium]|jgi:hypothetical protein|nr:aromatic-ring-opening dioxygenase LigAB, LigA subunit [Hyphomicrobiales bacterium]